MSLLPAHVRHQIARLRSRGGFLRGTPLLIRVTDWSDHDESWPITYELVDRETYRREIAKANLDWHRKMREVDEIVAMDNVRGSIVETMQTSSLSSLAMQFGESAGIDSKFALGIGAMLGAQLSPDAGQKRVLGNVGAMLLAHHIADVAATIPYEPTDVPMTYEPGPTDQTDCEPFADPAPIGSSASDGSPTLDP